ncbi:MAG: PHP domain-containing protein [Actinomycetales bacterium]
MHPVTALRRIGFLLERGRASTYRVKAYRRAALAIATIPEAELRQRATAGTLTEISGVGPKTATVIREALQGRPGYLAELEDSAGPLTAGGRELCSALRGDLHLHSDWSDGGSPIEEMAVTGVELGHEYLALTDHSPRLKVARGLSAERLRSQLAVVEALAPRLAPMRLLSGIEVDILDDGSLDQQPDLLARLDVVVASVHSKLAMEPAAMTRRMIAAVRNPDVDVLGHCTGRLVMGDRGTRPQSRFDAEAVFTACAEHGVAVEINARPERQDPPQDLMALALGAGCLFSLDTDAHAPGQLDWQVYGCERAEQVGVPAERIVNTWPVEDLLAWTARA